MENQLELAYTVIHKKKADKLCMAFDRLGKTWQSGAKYEENMTRWGIYKEKDNIFQ